ncbi:Shikimate kinase 1, chloroplastic [Glycine soja]
MCWTLQARGATSYISGIGKDNFGEEMKKKCTCDDVKLPMLAWYPCKFCCSRFQGEGVTLKFSSCLNMLLSIWEQLTFNFSFKESNIFLPATRSRGCYSLEALAHRITVVGTDSHPFLHFEAGNAHMEAVKHLSIIHKERSEAYANANARVSLKTKLGQRDVSDFLTTAIAMEVCHFVLHPLLNFILAFS